MRKAILALFAAAVLPATSHARSPRAQVDTNEFAVEVCTSAAVNISSHQAVNAATAGVSLSSASFINVFNADSTKTINFGYESNVSTISTNNAYGNEIAPKQDKGFQINLDKFSGLYFMSQSVTAATRAVVTLCR